MVKILTQQVAQWKRSRRNRTALNHCGSGWCSLQRLFL